MAEKPNYFESLKSTVIRADGLDSVPIQELELTLSVLLKWFPNQSTSRAHGSAPNT